ncbi:DUF6505 family protein [Falsigemmobacter faecalis]|uniref:Uncharacterized protein n=1 Tax=Falsigemmobacter faecalis TaxID=2488730 RepID=A0A3P3DVM5_9RHOB|nr:DUF6505 family protein [Falsigemmobacter faecalis]RRH78215.1 hypothetical protein EG244_01860 [Falsigemmobacter faecalis]
MVSLLRTLRLDASDGILFSPAAEPGEWAVPGGFLFHGRPFDSLSRKERVAFRSAFLGVQSFGFSTLAVVTRVTFAERVAAVEALAESFMRHLGAPDLQSARGAAEEEIAFSEELCRGHEEGRIIALHREEDEAGEIRERFRALRPRAETAYGAPGLGGHDRPFHFVESDEDEPGEGIDLFAGLRSGET